MPRRNDAAPRRNDVPVKIDGEVVRKARIVAAFRGQGLAEYLSEALGAVVDGHFAEWIAKETQAAQATRPAKGKGKGEGRSS